MRVIFLTVFLLSATVICSTVAAGKDYYRAAVVDYKNLQNDSLSPQENLMINVNYYGELIGTVSEEKVDIIVFPESGLLGSDSTLFIRIPDPAQKIVPADDPTYDESIQQLSELAKNSSIYIAVNLHENYTDPKTNKMFKYNTNVVFDKNGAVVARYRKFNLYDEPHIDRPEKPEHSYFDSDFGVRFGLFTSFDILFKDPALTLIKDYNVTHFIYPSEWPSVLPFLTSVQTQWMWAVGNDVKLLAAGLNRIDQVKVGSGIYRGKNALNLLYAFTDREGYNVLIGDVPIGRRISEGSGQPEYRSQIVTGEGSMKLHSHAELDNLMTYEDVELPNFKREICHHNLCCTFDLKTTTVPSSTQPAHYKAFVFDGQIKFSSVTKLHGLQTCGFFLCLNSSLSSCGPTAVNRAFSIEDKGLPVQFKSIHITGNFVKENANPLPNVLLWPNYYQTFLLSPYEVKFKNDRVDGSTSLSLKPNKQIITSGIHSRVFSRDTDQ